MASPGQLTTPELQAVLREGQFEGSWVLDATRSQVRLNTRHTWGLLPLHGVFRQVTGSGTVAANGDVSGILTVAAESVDTKNSTRDKHLRSADFFDVDNHPEAILTVTSATPIGPAQLRCQGEFKAAGHSRPVAFTADIGEATEQSAVVTAELEVDRTEFGMTWGPLHMTSATAYGTVTARFVRG